MDLQGYYLRQVRINPDEVEVYGGATDAIQVALADGGSVTSHLKNDFVLV